MSSLIKTFKVKVVREQGPDPLTGQILERAVEDMTIDATSSQAAHRIAQLMTTIQFRGQIMRVLVNGQEHPDETI